MEREIRREKIKPGEKVEDEDKKFEKVKEEMLKFLEGREGHYFDAGKGRTFDDMYKILPRTKRNKIENEIRASTELGKEKKEGTLRHLKALEEEAEDWQKSMKLFLSIQAKSEREWEEWKTKMEISRKATEAARVAADRIEGLSPEERELIKSELAKREKPKKGTILVEIKGVPIPLAIGPLGGKKWPERKWIADREGWTEKQWIDHLTEEFIELDMSSEDLEHNADYQWLDYQRWKKATEEVERERR